MNQMTRSAIRECATEGFIAGWVHARRTLAPRLLTFFRWFPTSTLYNITDVIIREIGRGWYGDFVGTPLVATAWMHRVSRPACSILARWVLLCLRGFS